MVPPVSTLKRELHRQDAKSAKKVDQPAHNPLFPQARPQGAVHLERGVHHLLGSLLNLFLRLVHCVFRI